MKRRKEPTWGEAFKQFWPAWIFIAGVLMVVLFVWAGTGYAGTYYWHVPDYNQFGADYDSLKYRITKDGAIYDSTTYTASDTIAGGHIEDSVSINEDSTYVAEASTFDGSSWSDWGTLIIPARTASVSLTGSGANSVVCLAKNGSDTLSGVFYTVQNSSGVTQAWHKSAHNLDTFSLGNATWTFILDKPGYTSVIADSAISGNDTLTFSMSADGSIASPASPALATVYGYLIDIQGNAIVGASIIVSRKGSPQMTDTTSANNIVSAYIDGGPPITDTTGLFSFSLVRSNYYKRPADGVYEITAEKGGVKIFDAIKITVPDTGSLNLGDTLAARF